jgi:hypothetical protein
MCEEHGNALAPKASLTTNGNLRRFGAYKNQFTIPDTFFDPLPECELKAWEGESYGGDPLHDANLAHGNRADL